MIRRQFHFYATASDLSPLLSRLEAQKPLQYTLSGLFETNRAETYLSYVDIPDLGRPNHPSSVANADYLVALQGTTVHVEDVPQRAGGIRYAIDQVLNEDAVLFRPGGRYGRDIFLYGEINTGSNSDRAKKLYDLMAATFREHLTKVREFLVGPEALTLAKAGVRLTLSDYTPPTFDLNRWL